MQFDESDFIPCEKCGVKAVDIHHIIPKGMGGSKTKDVIENLISLCRDCHNKAHDNKISKEELFKLHEEKMLQRLYKIGKNHKDELF